MNGGDQLYYSGRDEEGKLYAEDMAKAVSRGVRPPHLPLFLTSVSNNEPTFEHYASTPKSSTIISSKS